MFVYLFIMLKCHFIFFCSITNKDNCFLCEMSNFKVFIIFWVKIYRREIPIEVKGDILNFLMFLIPTAIYNFLILDSIDYYTFYWPILLTNLPSNKRTIPPKTCIFPNLYSSIWLNDSYHNRLQIDFCAEWEFTF